MSTDVTLPDGNSVNLPDYAMDSTMQDMLKVLKQMYKLDGGDTKNLEDLLKQARDDSRRDQKSQNEADKDREKHLEQLRQINESAKKSTLLSTDGLLSGMKAAGSGLMNLASGLTGMAAAAIGAVIQGTTNIGQTIRGLTEFGVGFDDASGSTRLLISDMQMLGMTLDEAAGRISSFSTAVQVMGKTDFATFTREMARASSFAQQFGLSITESVDLLAEDLELRSQLGMIEQLSAQQQAKSSQELFKRQVAASQLLGKSIDKLRGNSEAFVKESLDFQLNMARISSNMSATDAEAFRVAVQGAAAELEGAGLDAATAQRIVGAVMDPIAFAAKDGELIAAFGALGDGGTEMLANLRTINEGLNSTDPTVVAEATKQLGNLKGDFLELSKTIKPEDQAAFISALGDASPGMEAFFKGMISMRAAAEKTGTNLDGMAQAVTVFENSMATFRGAISGGFTNIMGAFSQPMEALADAFTQEAVKRNDLGEILDKNGNAMMVEVEERDKNGNMIKKMVAATKLSQLSEEERANTVKTGNSLLTVFTDSIKMVSDTFKNALGPHTAGMADTIRNNLQPMIESLANTLSGFIERISNADDPIAEIKKIIMEGWENNIKPALIDGINTVLMPALNGVWDAIKAGFLDFFTSPGGLALAFGGLALLLAPLIALAGPVTAIGVGLTALGAAIGGFLSNYFFKDTPEEQALAAAEESGLYDKDLIGKSEIDQEKLAETTDAAQLKAIIADNDITETDLETVKARLAQIESDASAQSPKPPLAAAANESQATSQETPTATPPVTPETIVEAPSAVGPRPPLATAGNTNAVAPQAPTPPTPAGNNPADVLLQTTADSMAADSVITPAEQKQIMDRLAPEAQERMLEAFEGMNMQLKGLTDLMRKVKENTQKTAEQM